MWVDWSPIIQPKKLVRRLMLHISTSSALLEIILIVHEAVTWPPPLLRCPSAQSSPCVSLPLARAASYSYSVTTRCCVTPGSTACASHVHLNLTCLCSCFSRHASWDQLRGPLPRLDADCWPPKIHSPEAVGMSSAHTGSAMPELAGWLSHRRDLSKEACYHRCALPWVCSALVVATFACSRLGKQFSKAPWPDYPAGVQRSQ